MSNLLNSLSNIIQAAFSKAKELVNPSSTGAVLCGHKQMAEVNRHSLVYYA